ncbi:MAG: exo-alpha-sialidase [Phycisphaerales bacterium]|nr:MAG: exo-alpha-sialidase [Phycisphaerales bacterium]
MAAAAAILCASTAWAQFEVGPQIRIDVNGGQAAANETGMASLHNDPDEIVGVWNDWRDSNPGEIIRMGVAVSSDGGLTWDDFLVRPPQQNQTTVEGDPMTAYDNRTGTLWVGAISFAGNGGLFVARKRPGQNSFEPSVMARAVAGADKCWMDAGPRPGNPNATNLYIAYNQGVLRSEDMGQTWSAPVSLGQGLGFLPRVGPQGELYVMYWDVSTGMMMRRSFDGGRTFDPPIRVATRLDVWGTQDGSRFPGTFRAPSLLYLAVDPADGTLYAVYFDTTNIVGGNRNVDLYFTKSENRGTSWDPPRVINFDNNPPGDQFFPWLEVDLEGNIHMVLLDSKNTIQNDNVQNGMFDAYYMFSGDGGESWEEARLTPRSWNSNDDGLNRGNSQFIGDYMGLGVGGNLVYPCYISTQNGDSDIYTNIIEVGGNPVPQACCFNDGSCENLLRSECTDRGGRSRFGDTCETFQCPQPGACCVTNFSCEILLERDCIARGGEFMGEGLPCEDICPCDVIKKLKGKCKGAGTLKGILKFKNDSWDGRVVKMGVGERLRFDVTVRGKKATLFTCCFAGPQELKLLDPDGCVSPVIVNCP